MRYRKQLSYKKHIKHYSHHYRGEGVCEFCGENLPDRFSCDICEAILEKVCGECHNEIEHGVINTQPAFTGTSGGFPDATMADLNYYGEYYRNI